MGNRLHALLLLVYCSGLCSMWILWYGLPDIGVSRTQNRNHSSELMSSNDSLVSLSIIIKTLDRPECLTTLVQKILSTTSEISIHIADDGMNLVQLPEAVRYSKRVRYYRLPRDSGVSFARNFLVSKVQTPYLLLMDDDYTFSPQLIVDMSRLALRYPNADIIAGKAGLSYAGLFKMVSRSLFLLPPTLESMENDVNCTWVDFVPNFFLARTSALSRIQWDQRLKTGEHEEFFLRAWQKYQPLKILYCPWMAVKNLQSGCDHTHSLARRRILLRSRAMWYISQASSRHNLDAIYYCIGDEFASTWERVAGPEGRTCLKLPLSHECPLGLQGKTCEECADGFTGPSCTECTSGRIGLRCKHCEDYCPTTATCEEGRTGDILCNCMAHHVGTHCLPCNCGLRQICSTKLDRPFCFCQDDSFGKDCNFRIISGNLLKEATFNVVSYHMSWDIWKDGCTLVYEPIQLSQADPVKLLLDNNGTKSCGLVQQVTLAQNNVSVIGCNASAELVNHEALEIEKGGMLCVWIDVYLVDGTTLWGQRAYFSWGITGWQQTEIVIKPNKPIAHLNVYVMVDKLHALLRLHSVACYVIQR